MSRILLNGVSALALAACIAAAPAVRAQVAIPDVTVEGPISSIAIASAPLPSQLVTAGPAVTTIGVIRLMGVDVKVRSDALIHTVTNDDLAVTAAGRDVVAALEKLKTGALPGRTEQGFIGGTAIISGDSLGGFIYAKDVFTDLFENVVVGESTGNRTVTDPVTGAQSFRAQVNFMDLVPINDERMPALQPMNIYGFAVDALGITPNTLLAAEGYFSKLGDGEVLYYHHIEADSAALLKNANGLYPANVSIQRANCRIRGRNRDELQLRGGVHSPATGTVTVQVLLPNGTWRNAVGARGPAVGVLDPATANPPQGEYRYDTTAENFGGTCPAKVRASYVPSANSVVSVVEAAPEIR